MNFLPEPETFAGKSAFTRENPWPCGGEPGVTTAPGHGCPGY